MMKFFTGWLLAAGMALARRLRRHRYWRLTRPAGRHTVPYPILATPTIRRRHNTPAALRAGADAAACRPRFTRWSARAGFRRSGSPQQRGYVYTISVIDRGGDDGRLIIDARTGRILRFIPAHRMGEHFNDDLTMNYGTARTAAADPSQGCARPPKSIPHVASRTVPVPKASPLAAAKPALPNR